MPPAPGQSVRCPRDGRVHDARSPGCPACVPEAARLERPGARPLAALLAAAGLAAGGALAWWLLPNRIQVSAEAPAAPIALAGTLDPTPYRVEIEAIEAILYRPTPPELGDTERVARAARELAERLPSDAGLSRVAALDALQRLMAFAAETDARGEAGYAIPALDGPRRSWEALRAALFRPAPWLRSGAPELVNAQRRAPLRADLIMLEDLAAWADALEVLLRAGRAEMAAFGEPNGDAGEGSREDRERIARWQAFATAWEARVTRAGASGPAPPAWDDEAHVVQAHQFLGRVVHHLRIASVPVGESAVPTDGWRQQSLDGAEESLAEARRQLEQARLDLAGSARP